jgi:hypothetical protein
LYGRLCEQAQKESTGLGLPRSNCCLDCAHRDQTIVKAIQTRLGRCVVLLRGRLIHSPPSPNHSVWPFFSRARVYGWPRLEKLRPKHYFCHTIREGRNPYHKDAAPICRRASASHLFESNIRADALTIGRSGPDALNSHRRDDAIGGFPKTENGPWRRRWAMLVIEPPNVNALSSIPTHASSRSSRCSRLPRHRSRSGWRPQPLAARGRPAPPAHRAGDALRRDVHRHRGVGLAATPLKASGCGCQEPRGEREALGCWALAGGSLGVLQPS